MESPHERIPACCFLCSDAGFCLYPSECFPRRPEGAGPAVLQGLLPLAVPEALDDQDRE